MVAAFDWPLFFLLTVLTALPGLILLRFLRPVVLALDDDRSAERQQARE